MMKQKEVSTIYTIGHSSHEFNRFVALLKRHGIEAVADVRSTPYSRWQPQFNREDLESALKTKGIAYVFLGKELGARREDPACYESGRVKFRKIAQTALFQAGLQRVRDGSERMRVALMCAEREPLECHRTILVTRELVRSGSKVAHILANGDVESHEIAMKRLFADMGLPEHELFRSEAELLDNAYAEQEKRIAYIDENLAKEAAGAANENSDHRLH